MSKDTASKQADSKGRNRRPVQSPAPESQSLDSPGLQQALNEPAGTRPAIILNLQNKVGNRAVQRLLDNAQDVQRQPAVGLEGGEVEADLQSQIESARGGGRPLDPNVGEQIGRALGADFSGVRVHTNSQADTLNRSLSAKAFTLGSDIFFSQGAYNPGTHSGKQLLAHELTHVIQQGGGKANKLQTKLTVGAAGDKYEDEADRVAGQVMRSLSAPPLADEVSPGSLQRSPFIQRKSDKLKQKAHYTAQAKGGAKLFGATKYDKVMKAIDVYHGLGGADYMAQLQQLVKIAALVDEWEIAHGTVDSTNNKNVKEGARRGVLSTLRSTDIPLEIADVYRQAKTNGDQPDVHLLMLLMDAAQGDPGARAPIESDYAAALRSYQAGGGDTATAMGVLSGGSFFSGAGGDRLTTKLNSVRGLSDDPTWGAIPTQMLDAPVSGTDSDNMKEMKKQRRKLRALVPALGNMSDIEIMSIAAYTDEGGYGPMGEVLRGGRTVSGGSKQARKQQAKLRKEVQQANLMAASALNKLPDWDGSMVYRGEDIGWLGHDPTAGETVMLKSFTSTAANKTAARGFAAKGTPNTSAVWNISGVTSQGKDISKLSLVQNEIVLGEAIGFGNQTQEDEVLLKPYTRLRIDRVTPGVGYRFEIEATAL